MVGKRGRPPKQDIKAGDIFGELAVRAVYHTKKDGVKVRVACLAIHNGVQCGVAKTVPILYLRRDVYPMRHCGCRKHEGANPYPREKGIWWMIFKRTEDPTHVSYKYYGEAGIKCCWEWHKDNPQGWDNFIKFMGPAPSKKHSLDRVNPFLGYQPYQEDGVTPQCRWATAKTQANNQKHHWANKHKE